MDIINNDIEHWDHEIERKMAQKIILFLEILTGRPSLIEKKYQKLEKAIHI